MPYEFDAIDVKIVNLLQQDARLTHKEIAARIGKSLNAVYERTRRLERDGVIKGYVALVDNSQVERGQVAFTHVQLKDHSRAALSAFEEEIIKSNEVMECYHMSGTYDFILKVATRDLATYHVFLMDTLFGIMSVGSVQSTFVMKQAKFETAYVLDVAKAGKAS
jgi:Lrp/AsnC family leucine-responsive transcriptional regulator